MGRNKVTNFVRTFRPPKGHYVTNITYIDYEYDEILKTIIEPRGVRIFYRKIGENGENDREETK